jgi:hypothetical protein
MSRLKSGTGVALNEEESDGARVCPLPGEFSTVHVDNTSTIRTLRSVWSKGSSRRSHAGASITQL